MAHDLPSSGEHLAARANARGIPMKHLFLAVLAVAAVTEANAGGWTGDLTVISAFTEGHTDLVIAYTTGGATYTAGCAANSWALVADSDARRGRAYATLLTALATGQKVRFWYADSCPIWGYHGMTTVMLMQ